MSEHKRLYEHFDIKPGCPHQLALKMAKEYHPHLLLRLSIGRPEKSSTAAAMQDELKQARLKRVYKFYGIEHGSNIKLILAIAEKNCPKLLEPPPRRKKYSSGRLTGLWMGLLPFFKMHQHKWGKSKSISERETAEQMSSKKILEMDTVAILKQLHKEKHEMAQQRIEALKHYWKEYGIAGLKRQLCNPVMCYPADMFDNMADADIEQFLNSKELSERCREVILKAEHRISKDGNEIKIDSLQCTAH